MTSAHIRCPRCGRDIVANLYRRDYIACKDCRQADPEWVKAVTKGVKIA